MKKVVKVIADWLRFEILGVSPKTILEAVRSNGALIRTVATELSRIRATVTNQTMLVNATREDVKGLVTMALTQEEQLQQHKQLLVVIGGGVSEILRRLAAIPTVTENPAINDEIADINAAGQSIADQINAVLNPAPVTGEPVGDLPVNSGNEHLIIGGTTSDTPKRDPEPTTGTAEAPAPAETAAPGILVEGASPAPAETAAPGILVEEAGPVDPPVPLDPGTIDPPR